MIQIKVTAILISKNVKPYISECLRSVCDQTMNEIEILCIDAFSNDGTREIISEFAERDPRVKLIDDDKGSTGYSNNIGIEMAKGEYIAFIETDDYIKPDMFETLYKIAKEKDCDYIKSDYYAYWTTDDNERVFAKRKTFSDDAFYGKVLVPREHKELAYTDWYVWKGLYKKGFLIKNKIFFSETKGAAFQDIGFLHQTITRAERALYLDDCHYCYCIDRDDASSNSSKVLVYAWQEFSRLIDIESQLDVYNGCHLYTRMAKSLICCCRGIAATERKTPDNTDYCEWFYEEIGVAFEKGYLDEKTLSDGLYNRLEDLLEKHLSYSDLMKKKESEIETFLEKKESEIVIFGCGNYGHSAFRWLTTHSYRVMAYMDNNTELWGRRVNETLIDCPNNAVSYGRNVKFIIANESYYESIRNQLLEYGIEDRQIFVYE